MGKIKISTGLGYGLTKTGLQDKFRNLFEI
jgi:hypothetical protein